MIAGGEREVNVFIGLWQKHFTNHQHRFVSVITSAGSFLAVLSADGGKQ